VCVCVCVFLIVCDLGTLTVRRPKTELGCCASKKIHETKSEDIYVEIV